MRASHIFRQSSRGRGSPSSVAPSPLHYAPLSPRGLPASAVPPPPGAPGPLHGVAWGTVASRAGVVTVLGLLTWWVYPYFMPSTPVAAVTQSGGAGAAVQSGAAGAAPVQGAPAAQSTQSAVAAARAPGAVASVQAAEVAAGVSAPGDGRAAAAAEAPPVQTNRWWWVIKPAPKPVAAPEGGKTSK